MNALVVYESVYGNTRTIAEAIAGAVGGRAVAVREAPMDLAGIELLIVGGPTHMHGMATHRSRQMAVEAVREDGTGHVEPGAADEPGLRTWLREVSDGSDLQAAAFDTRADKAPWLSGAASRGIAKRLGRRGYDVVATESFLVEDPDGPLADGELDRTSHWGEQLARSRSRATTA